MAGEFESNWVPLYYEGGQTIGKAKVSADGKYIEMQVADDGFLAELMKDNLVGFSTVKLRDKPDDFQEEVTTKEKTDDV